MSTPTAPQQHAHHQQFAMVRQIASGLEGALGEARRMDEEVQELLGQRSFWGRIPIIKDIIRRFRPGTDPKALGMLEERLRGSFNSTISAVGGLVSYARTEQERLESIRGVYETAQREQWTPFQYLEFIERNTDLRFTTQVDNGTIDMKDALRELYDSLPEERREEMRREHLQWLHDHIAQGEDYLESMRVLGGVAALWIDRTSRSYFHLTQQRHGVELIQGTMSRVQEGVENSYSSEILLRGLCTSYAKGMLKLVEGYHQVNRLHEQGNAEFGQVLNQVRAALEQGSAAPKQLRGDGRYLLPDTTRSETRAEN